MRIWAKTKPKFQIKSKFGFEIHISVRGTRFPITIKLKSAKIFFSANRSKFPLPHERIRNQWKKHYILIERLYGMNCRPKIQENSKKYLFSDPPKFRHPLAATQLHRGKTRFYSVADTAPHGWNSITLNTRGNVLIHFRVTMNRRSVGAKSSEKKSFHVRFYHI